jgi:DNA-binding NarL/FixJ family response regulator
MGHDAPRGMGNRTLRALLVEDSPADAELLQLALQHLGMELVAQRVDTREAFTRAMQEFVPDVVLSDHGLPQFDATAALDLLRAVRPTVPLIVVVGVLDERTFVACLRAGVEDFVLKENLSRLRPVIESALAVREPLRRLTPRQLEVLQLVTQGHTTRDIAQRLAISIKTVETHRNKMMQRLGIHDIAGLVRYAVRVGLVTSDSGPALGPHPAAMSA